MTRPAATRQTPGAATPTTGPWAHRLWWLLIAGLLIAGASVGSRPRRGADFRVYLTASERFVAGEGLYRETDGTMPFKYAPATAALFMPFTLLDRRVAVATWNVLAILALAWAAHLAARLASAPDQPAEWPWARVVATAAILPAIAFELFYSQVDAAQLLLIVAAAVGAERGRTWGPAVALTIAVLLKPPAIVVGLYFLLRRHWKVIGAGVVTTAAAMALVALRYGPQGALQETRAWAELLARTTAPWALNPNAQGVPTLLTAVADLGGIPPTGSVMLAAQGIALVAFVGFVLWARPSRSALFAAVCLAVALLSPQAWRANFVLGLPAALLAAQARAHSTTAALLGVALVGAIASGVSITPTMAALLSPRPFAVAYGALLIALLLHDRATSTTPAPPRAEPA